MVDRFEVFYPNNFLWRTYRIFPYLSFFLIKLTHEFFPPKPLKNYESSYGTTSGLYGPSEFGEFWYKFFPHNPIAPERNVYFDYVDKKEISEDILNVLNLEMKYIYSVYNYPLLFKNVYNTLRIHGLIKALPRSVFIITWRDPKYLAASIYNARIKKYGSKDCWLSVEPKEIKEILSYPVWDQIMLQIYYLYNQILEYIAAYGGKKFYMVDYQLLAENPLNTLDEIALFLEANNIKIKQRNISIEKFSYRKTEPMDPEEKDMWIESYQKYRAKFERLYITLKERTWKEDLNEYRST